MSEDSHGEDELTYNLNWRTKRRKIQLLKHAKNVDESQSGCPGSSGEGQNISDGDTAEYSISNEEVHGRQYTTSEIKGHECDMLQVSSGSSSDEVPGREEEISDENDADSQSEISVDDQTLEQSYLKESETPIDVSFETDRADSPYDSDDSNAISDTDSADLPTDDSIFSEEGDMNSFDFGNDNLDVVLVCTQGHTLREAIVLDLAMSLKHNWTYEALISNFINKNVIHGVRCFPETKKSFWKAIGKSSAGILKHGYCNQEHCAVYFRRLDRLPEQVKGPCGHTVNRADLKWFVSLDLRRQC